MSRPRTAPVWAWLLIALMLGSLIWLLNRLTDQTQHAHQCRQNLEKIFHILTLYELEHGQLPSLALFPEEPLLDNESLLVVLRAYGMDPAWGICPAAAGVIRDHGLSYLWNTALNHRSLSSLIEPVWMLVDLQALDDRIPGPHFGGYHILYTDGRVERSMHPPHTLPVHFD